MDQPYPLIEFESEVGQDGTIKLPMSLIRDFAENERVTIRLTRGTITASLRDRGVTEEEIESISLRQSEPRGNVIGFLKAEGDLKSQRSFIRRMKTLFEK